MCLCDLSSKRNCSQPQIIHVFSLARLHEPVEKTGARHSLRCQGFERLDGRGVIAADNHLIRTMDDISVPWTAI